MAAVVLKPFQQFGTWYLKQAQAQPFMTGGKRMRCRHLVQIGTRI